MQTRHVNRAPPSAATWANLAVPGAGLVLVGRVRTGVVIGVAFAISANAAIAARLITPDDISLWAQNLSIIIAGVAYVAAQGLLLSGARGDPRLMNGTRRRETIRELEALANDGDWVGARRVIDANTTLAESDLHVAYLCARILTEAGDDKAREAWSRLGRLDRHGIYREERCSGLERAVRSSEA